MDRLTTCVKQCQVIIKISIIIILAITIKGITITIIITIILIKVISIITITTIITAIIRRSQMGALLCIARNQVCLITFSILIASALCSMVFMRMILLLSLCLL